jgi:hypothetical protein
MKIIVTLAQLTFLCFVAYSLIYNPPPMNGQGIAISLLFTITPLITLYYIHLRSVSKDTYTYLGLVMERRRLEEQAKVDKLKSEDK